MVTTRSQSLSTRLQTTTKTTRQLSDKTISQRPVTRSHTLTARTHSRATKCPSASVVEYKHVRKHTSSPYATRSKRMNTRSNAKRFLELSDREHVQRMTRSMSKFVEKYSDYTGVNTRSMTKCM